VTDIDFFIAILVAILNIVFMGYIKSLT